MPNKPMQKPFTRLENALYKAFSNTYDNERGVKTAKKTGLTNATISALKHKHNKFVNSRLCVLCQIFPNLERAIIEFLKGDFQSIDYQDINELSNSEKIELIRKLVASLEDQD